MQIIVALLIALALGAGVSFSANDALPGDGLYAVKVGVNERLREAFAADDAARARVHAELAGRRLDESETVAAGATLRAEIAARLKENFEMHASRLEDRVEALDESGRAEAALEASSDFEASLEAHARILAALEAEADDSEERDGVESLREAAEEKEDDMENIRVRLETDVGIGPDVQAAAEGRLGAATNKITEVRAFIDGVETGLGATATASARARLAVAEAAVAEGEAKLEADAYADAFVLFSVAHRIAQEAQLLAAAGLDLDVELDRDEQEAEDEAEDDVSETGIEIEFEAEDDDEDKDDEGGAEVEVDVKAETDVSY